MNGMGRLWIGFWSALLLAALLALLSGLFLPRAEPPVPAEIPVDAGLHTGEVSAPREGGPIVLPLGTHRQPFALEALRGQFVWLYFGYTSCPDACPMSLGWMSVAMNRLPPDLADRVRGVFISVDPERDTPERLREYVAHFHPRIEAATGDVDQLRRIASAYGVFFAATEIESALGYVVDHSSVVFLLGPDGRILEVHPHGTQPGELLEALERHRARIDAEAEPSVPDA